MLEERAAFGIEAGGRPDGTPQNKRPPGYMVATWSQNQKSLLPN